MPSAPKTMKNLGLLPLLALAAVGHAATATYHVTQKLSALPSGQTGSFSLYLDFQLTDGAQTGIDNSTVRIQNIALSGGTIDYADRSVADIGLVTGTNTDFTLHNSLDALGRTLSERSVLFNFGAGAATLSYDFTLANTSVDSPIPDGFAAGMLYRTGSGPDDVAYVGTLKDTEIEMVASTFDGRGTRPAPYGVSPDFVAAHTGDSRFARIGTPVITPVPEPAALVTLGLGALALLHRRKRG